MNESWRKVHEDPELLAIEEGLQRVSLEAAQVQIDMRDGTISSEEGEAKLERLMQQEQEIRTGPAYERWERAYSDEAEEPLSGKPENQPDKTDGV